MARCRRCECPDVTSCLCSFGDSDCIEVTGLGTTLSPFIASPILDPDLANLMECSVSGLAAFLPPEIADPPACRLTHTTPQAIANNTDTVLAFNEERFDTDSMHDNTTNNFRITINTAGVYVLAGHVQWEGNSTGDRKLWFMLNLATVIGSTEDSVNRSDVYDQSVFTIWKFDAGDFINLVVRQDSGVALNIEKTVAYSPEFAAARVAVG